MSPETYYLDHFNPDPEEEEDVGTPMTKGLELAIICVLMMSLEMIIVVLRWSWYCCSKCSRRFLLPEAFVQDNDWPMKIMRNTFRSL